MPADVIERIEMMALQNMNITGLSISDRNQNPMDGSIAQEDDIDEIEYETYPEYNINDPEHEGYIQYEMVIDDNDEDGHIYDRDPHINVVQDVIAQRGEIAVVQEMLSDENNNVYDDNHDNEDSAIESTDNIERNSESGDEPDMERDEEHDNIDEAMNARYGPRTNNYNLRPRRERNYDHLFINHTMPVTTPQMNMKQGIIVFGKAGVQAVKKELLQLHERKVMMAQHATNLTRIQKRQALAYLMFLKRKRCGTIKARGCADGRKQRGYIAKEDAASPTVSTEALFITAVVDALEEREVAVVDVPGAFMQADMDSLVHVRFTGKMVELLLEIDPEGYGPYITTEKDQKVLYVKLLKALYGTIRAARLFYDKLCCKLQEWGFEINKYDACVANKTVNGKQLTITWHVDDLKVSHVDATVVNELLLQLDDEFGKETPTNKSH